MYQPHDLIEFGLKRLRSAWRLTIEGQVLAAFFWYGMGVLSAWPCWIGSARHWLDWLF